MHFNQEARAKHLEHHIIFILDLTVSHNIDRFVLTFIIRLMENMDFYTFIRFNLFNLEASLKKKKKYGPFWEISCGADIER